MAAASFSIGMIIDIFKFLDAFEVGKGTFFYSKAYASFALETPSFNFQSYVLYPLLG